MFLGVDCFKDESVFNSTVILNNAKELELGNGEFDEVYITRSLSDIENKQDNSWVYGETIFATHFDNTLSGGNLSSNLNVGYIKVKRRDVDNLKIEDLKIIPYIPDKKKYSYTDNFVESLEQYEYSLQPIGRNGALGISQSTESDLVDFDGAYLLTEDKILHLYYNLEVGDYGINIPTSVNETVGYQYPFIMTNGLTKYKKGNIKCRVIADSTVQSGGQIDRKAEKKYRSEIYDFLTDKRPKVYKDSSGEYMVVSIIGEPKLTPSNELSQKIYDLSFDFVEVGSKELLTLHHTGVIK